MKKEQLAYPIVFFLTLIDMVFTAGGLKLGIITEANPIVNYFIGKSMALTLLFIPAYVGAALLLLYRLRQGIRWLNAAMTSLAVIKLFIVFLHIKWLSEYSVLYSLL